MCIRDSHRPAVCYIVNYCHLVNYLLVNAKAFRFQNKLQSMMADAQSSLRNNGNITKVQNT